jgi:hypothetical protein
LVLVGKLNSTLRPKNDHRVFMVTKITSTLFWALLQVIQFLKKCHPKHSSLNQWSRFRSRRLPNCRKHLFESALP